MPDVNDQDPQDSEVAVAGAPRPTESGVPWIRDFDQPIPNTFDNSNKIIAGPSYNRDDDPDPEASEKLRKELRINEDGTIADEALNRPDSSSGPSAVRDHELIEGNSGGDGTWPAKEDDESHDEGSTHDGEDDEPSFDPADFSAEDVINYANENPDERAAILEAEKKGKNRTTVVRALTE